MTRIVTTGPVVIEGKIYAKGQTVDVSLDLSEHLIRAGYAVKEGDEKVTTTKKKKPGRPAKKKTRTQKAYRVH